MSDGEIYYPIEYGIRLSGMPAFGDGGDKDVESWKLVTFIRHLPALTPEETQEMEHLNPKGPDEYQDEMNEGQFLTGKTPSAPTATMDHMKGHSK